MEISTLHAILVLDCTSLSCKALVFSSVVLSIVSVLLLLIYLITGVFFMIETFKEINRTKHEEPYQ